MKIELQRQCAMQYIYPVSDTPVSTHQSMPVVEWSMEYHTILQLKEFGKRHIIIYIYKGMCLVQSKKRYRNRIFMACDGIHLKTHSRMVAIQIWVKLRLGLCVHQSSASSHGEAS